MTKFKRLLMILNIQFVRFEDNTFVCERQFTSDRLQATKVICPSLPDDRFISIWKNYCFLQEPVCHGLHGEGESKTCYHTQDKRNDKTFKRDFAIHDRIKGYHYNRPGQSKGQGYCEGFFLDHTPVCLLFLSSRRRILYEAE